MCKRIHSIVREHILCKYLAYTDSRRGRCYEKIWYLAYKLFRFHLNVAVDDEDVPRLRTHVCVRLAINNASSATVLYRTAWRAVTDTKLDGSPLINENLKGDLPHPVYNMYVLIVDGEGDECPREHLEDATLRTAKATARARDHLLPHPRCWPGQSRWRVLS